VRYGQLENSQCPSEPKLGIETTGLQGDSLNWVTNLTAPTVYVAVQMKCSFC